MKVKPKFLRLRGVIACIFFVFLSAAPVFAALTPEDPYLAAELPAPDPAVFLYQSAIAYFENQIIYAGNDGKIYAMDKDSGASTLVSDTSPIATDFAAPTGFLVSSDGYLYFHDNGITTNIYRLNLADAWPAEYASFDPQAQGFIYDLTQNPWTDAIWFASSDFPPGNMYLYEINSAFTAATIKASFPQPNAGGSGPVIFKGKSTLLYGESIFMGDGFFHLLDSTTGNLIEENYLTFDGGLTAATYVYNNIIVVTTGSGKTVNALLGSEIISLATSDDDAQGVAFEEDSLYVSEMVAFGGEPAGFVKFNQLKDPQAQVITETEEPFRAAALQDPDPEVFRFQSSIAVYNSQIIYGDAVDGSIYAYDPATGSTALLSDTSSLKTGFTAVTGFLVSSDNYLYFHDNGITGNIYRLNLTDPWPVAFESFNSNAQGFIYAFTQNPWTGTVWFSSSDFPPGKMYLYEINETFTGADLAAAFDQPNAGGSGPIIFQDERTVLYGESVFMGNGFFHLLDSVTGDIIEENFATFDGGLSAATYGYDNDIFVTTGAGRTIYRLAGSGPEAIATTLDDAQSIVFNGISFFFSQMAPFSGSEEDGFVSFHQLWQTLLSGVAAEQVVGDNVDLNEDGIPDNEQMDVIMSVVTEGGSGAKAIGISVNDPDTVFLEAVESTELNAVDDVENRPDDFPFGLVNYRLRVTSPDGIARVTIYFSEPTPENAVWYKWDPINGWVDYSAHAVFSNDRMSVEVETKDGDYGDFDRIVNGQILDPAGVGVPKSTSTPSPAPPAGDGGGSSGACFISSAASASSIKPMAHVDLVVLLLALAGAVAFAKCNRQTR